MPVQLIIEDGSIVADANSYGIDHTNVSTTIAAARQYALNRGVDMSGKTDDQVSTYLILGTDYLESFEFLYIGRPTTSTQALSWPRKCVRLDPNNWFPDNEIPQILLNALYQLCIEQFNGIQLLATDNRGAEGGFIIKERVDVIETEYSERIGTTVAPVMPSVDALLAPLLSTRAGLGGLMAVRV